MPPGGEHHIGRPAALAPGFAAVRLFELIRLRVRRVIERRRQERFLRDRRCREGRQADLAHAGVQPIVHRTGPSGSPGGHGIRLGEGAGPGHGNRARGGSTRASHGQGRHPHRSEMLRLGDRHVLTAVLATALLARQSSFHLESCAAALAEKHHAHRALPFLTTRHRRTPRSARAPRLFALDSKPDQ